MIFRKNNIVLTICGLFSVSLISNSPNLNTTEIHHLYSLITTKAVVFKLVTFP